MTTLHNALLALDAFLTRKDQRTVEHTQSNQKINAEEFLGREYYLSDGGYSRVILSWQTFRLFLTDNSRTEVKSLWKFAKELIADVEHAAHAELTLLGYDINKT